MKVTFHLDNGANVHSCRSQTFDLSTDKGERQLGYTKEEWLEKTFDEKYEVLKEWADSYIEFYFEEEEG